MLQTVLHGIRMYVGISRLNTTAESRSVRATIVQDLALEFLIALACWRDDINSAALQGTRQPCSPELIQGHVLCQNVSGSVDLTRQNRHSLPDFQENMSTVVPKTQKAQPSAHEHAFFTKQQIRYV